MSLEVLKPGLLSTFQDLGRTGSQAMGMPVCGAMDGLSHRIANLIAGNAPEEATLEITLMGPALRFGREGVLALAGADLSATLLADGAEVATPVPLFQPVRVSAGSLLQFGRRRAGVRCHLAIAGGFGLPAVLGSRSTYLRGALGGFRGRALRKGDVMTWPEAATGAPAIVGATANALLMGLLERGANAAVRIVDGPEWAQFTDDSRHRLLSESFRIGSQSDRMGYRLEGGVLQRTAPRDMLSEAVAFGTVQVPPDGQPIVLMADRQTSGGYPRIAQVASVDLPLLAQRMPGETIRFERISLDAAQQLLRRRAQALSRLGQALFSSTNPETPPP